MFFCGISITTGLKVYLQPIRIHLRQPVREEPIPRYPRRFVYETVFSGEHVLSAVRVRRGTGEEVESLARRRLRVHETWGTGRNDYGERAFEEMDNDVDECC